MPCYRVMDRESWQVLRGRPHRALPQHFWSHRIDEYGTHFCLHGAAVVFPVQFSAANDIGADIAQTMAKREE